MRSVHTAASVHSHGGGTSLPCLAKGTPGSLICSCVSFTLPPSCPPSLHGRYPFPRYYEDSDFCPAPFCTWTGILGSRSCASGHSVSTHLMRPCGGMALAPPQAWPPTRLGDYRRFFGLRALLAVSSVASGRIEFVSGVPLGLLSLRTIHSLQLLSTSPRGDAVTYSYWRLAPPGRDFHPSAPLRSQAHERRPPGRLTAGSANDAFFSIPQAHPP